MNESQKLIQFYPYGEIFYLHPSEYYSIKQLSSIHLPHNKT